MWVRETLEDITAAEFASSLSVESDADADDETTTTNGGVRKTKRKKTARAVDFNNILTKLDARIEEMCVLSTPEVAKQLNQTCHILNRRVVDHTNEGDEIIIENACYSLADEIGMGSVVYTKEQREALLSRLIGTRERLANFIEGGVAKEKGNGVSDGDENIDDIRSQLDTTSSAEGETGGTRGSTFPTTKFDPSLYVREDGTVDWDGALQDREALKKFGSAVWSRINGQDPTNDEENDDGENVVSSGGGEFAHAPTKAVTAKIEETVAIREKREQLDMLMNKLQTMEMEHTKLLNSGESFYYHL